MQPPRHSMAGLVHASFGVYTYGAAPSANDLANMCKLPKNSLVLWGFMATDDIDTGTEALEIDLGFTANGGGAATLTGHDGTTWTNNNSGSASATAFIDSGVLTGDTVTDLMAGMNWRPLQGIKTGPMFFSEETVVQAKITAAANAGGTGTVYVLMLYIML
jgi:hypothetical protein